MSTPEHGPAGTDDKPFSERAGEAAKKGLHQAAIWAGLFVLAVIVHFIAAAFIPRWWANTVGNWVHNSIAKGTALGLTFGIVCTAVPLLLLYFAVRRIRSSPRLAAAASVLAVIVAVPNLLTAGIAIGVTGTARDAQTVLTSNAPMFRGATMWGAIIGLVVAVAIPIGLKVWTKRAAAREIQRAADKAAAKQAKEDARAQAKAAKTAARAARDRPRDAGADTEE